MELALRRRLEGVVDVSISQRDQTAAVTFAPGTLIFSASEFRAAIAEADVTVLTIDMEVCGSIDMGNVLRLSDAIGTSTLQLRPVSKPVVGAARVVGRLKGDMEPYQIDVVQVRPKT
jgi:hypothetical protein